MKGHVHLANGYWLVKPVWIEYGTILPTGDFVSILSVWQDGWLMSHQKYGKLKDLSDPSSKPRMHTVVQKRQKGSTDLDHRHFYYFFSLGHFKHWVTASSWLPLVLEVTKSESFTRIHCQLKEESHRKFEIQPSTKSTRSCKLMWTCKTLFQVKKKGGETQGRETKGGRERFKENGTVLYLAIWWIVMFKNKNNKTSFTYQPQIKCLKLYMWIVKDFYC